MVWREGSITAAMNRENAETITSTGSIASWPNPTVIFVAGNHRSDPLPEPGDRAGPPDPLGDHRRRHRGIGRQQRPDPRLHLADRRRRAGPHVLRRTLTGQRTGHRVSRDTQLPCDSPLRQPFAAVKMPNQGPVFQGDHPSNLIGWPTFQPSRLAGFSTVVNTLGSQHPAKAVYRRG
jgi:hypothetical protein